MANSGAEFAAGHQMMVEGFHVTPRRNRESIERHGLIPGPGMENYDTGERNVGVFGAATKRDVDVDWAEGRSWEDVVANKPAIGGDIFRWTAPASRVEDDTWTTNYAAVKHRGPIPAKNVERVGHVTPNWEVHWHKEEHCNG